MRRFAVLLLALIALSPAQAAKDKPDKGRGRGRDKAAVHVTYFSSGHRTILTEYCHGLPGGLPPGMKHGALPPGLAKQLRRKGHLPPGLEKKLVVFPADLDGRMASVYPGLQRGFVGQFAIIWNPASRVIVDVVSLH
jgi:hypothetical protein